MKTHRAALEGAFFATAALWMSPQRTRPEYRHMAMQSEASFRILGLSLAQLKAICEDSDFQQVMLKGTDELNHLALEVEVRQDAVHSQCFRLGTHCGNLLGAATCGSNVPGLHEVLPAYFRNIQGAAKGFPTIPPPVNDIIALAPAKVFFNTLIPLVQKLADWFESYSDAPAPFYFISYSRVDSDFVSDLERILEKVGARYFLDAKDIEWGGYVDNEISSALQKCTHLIVLISPASLKSTWVPYEIGQAKANGKKILPLLTHISLDLPGYMSNLNYKVGLKAAEQFFTARGAASGKP